MKTSPLHISFLYAGRASLQQVLLQNQSSEKMPVFPDTLKAGSVNPGFGKEPCNFVASVLAGSSSYQETDCIEWKCENNRFWEKTAELSYGVVWCIPYQLPVAVVS